jgi:predicted nucleotidyltransferase component of viral defense system
MLSLDQIKKYYPENLRPFERFLIREYLQCKILEIIFDSKYANQFAFIGGTALRLIYGSERFSEDLDFDNFGLTPEVFSEISSYIRYQLELEGYIVEIRNVERGAFHCYIRFPKLLYESGLTGQEEEKILIRLDSEAQHFDFKPEAVVFNRFDIFTEINVTPGNILLSQKFYTVINRQRNKGRDFYDIVFLLGRNFKPDYGYLNLKLSIKNGLELKNRLLDKLEALNMEEMVEDVRPFLINIKDEKKIRLFKTFLDKAELD